MSGLEGFHCILSCSNLYVLLSSGVTVEFERPSYTFTENGVTGTIVVVKSGIPSSPFTVRVTGGTNVHIYTHYRQNFVKCDAKHVHKPGSFPVKNELPQLGPQPTA